MITIDKDTISLRKKVYGNNFPDIAKSWGEHLNVDLTPEDAAYMMYLLKISRENYTKSLLDNNEFDELTRKKLSVSLEDSINDKNSYKWISENYEEYLSL